jgi:hypothetical protein
MNITLSPENAALVDKWAHLAGSTPSEFLNEVLKDDLNNFEDEYSGYAKDWLGSRYYKDRQSAERVVAWIIADFTRDRDPDWPAIRIESEIREHQPGGKFDFSIKVFTRQGVERIC